MPERDPIARDTDGDGITDYRREPDGTIYQDTNYDGLVDKIEYPDGRVVQDTDYDGVNDTVTYTGENNPYRVPPEPGIQGEENHTGGRLPLPDTGIPPVPDSKHQAEERARAEEDLGPQTSPSSTPEDLAKQQAEERARAEEDLVEEPAPAPGIQGEDENLAKGHLPGLVAEAPRVQPTPPVTQTPESEPPPPGDPMGIDPLFEQDLFNPDAPGPTISRDLFDPTAPGETLDTGLIPDLAQNPQLAEKVNEDPDMAATLARDPGMIDQLKQDASLYEGEPSSVTDQGFLTHPSHTETPSPEPSAPEQDHLDDHVSM
jgi:hypothetical protein